MSPDAGTLLENHISAGKVPSDHLTDRYREMMVSSGEERLFTDLTDWYDANRRILPWRENPTPYHVWISEIMLQQTRVEAVKAYYERFIRELPDVKALAACSEDRYLKLWEGLGYYSRVRNLHAAAEEMVEKYEGSLPASYEELLKMKGIGSYTAGAISSIAFGLPEPAVDGNVLRVMTRLLGDFSDIADPAVKKEMEALLRASMRRLNSDYRSPGTFNQALMELGALVCLPNGSPHCEKCPWQQDCKAFQEKLTDRIPFKSPKKKRRIEEKTILLLQHKDSFAIQKRPAGGLLAGLYEYPWIEGGPDSRKMAAWCGEHGLCAEEIRSLPEAKHIFTHLEWRMKGYLVRLKEKDSRYEFVAANRIKKEYALPSALRVYEGEMERAAGAYVEDAGEADPKS